jgi:methylmalonyl-CoA/ethylmalonyl-CoA epimerase
MLLNLGQIGQIALPASDVDRSEAFYEKVVGLRKLFRFGDLTFFDCAAVRLLIEKVQASDTVTQQGCIYFRWQNLLNRLHTLSRGGEGAVIGAAVSDAVRVARPRPLTFGLMLRPA